MRYYQISSGSGPSECELAVAKFLAFLFLNFENLRIIQTVDGHEDATFKSVYLESETDLGQFAGTIQWICKSPYRPDHRRKNWFISFQEFDEQDLDGFDESQIAFQTMRAAGPGGQNVNRVETAVRATWLPDGFSTVCRSQRSQLANKKRAVARIKIHLLEQARAAEAERKKEKWSQHNSLERGRAKACFQGEEFERVR